MTTKWSAFTAGSAITGTDTTVGLQSSANVKWTYTQAATFFWASPTLVTPALGTPASGLLSSCTGLPLTTGITGTLGAANGGTGVANNASSTLTISGNFATTLTVTGATGVTLPTSGTLATLAGSEALTNKTVNGNTFTAGTYTLTGTAAKTLNFTNTLTLSGTDSTTMTFPASSGTVVTLAESQTLTNKTLTSPTLTTPALGVPASGTLTNCTGLPVAGGGTGTNTLTANNVILGNTTSAVQFVAPSTSGNVLTSNGTTWQSTAPSGTTYSAGAGITLTTTTFSVNTNNAVGVGAYCMIYNVSAGSIASGSTAAGAALQYPAMSDAATAVTVSSTGTVSGTWRNISGYTVGNAGIALWIRTA